MDRHRQNSVHGSSQQQSSPLQDQDTTTSKYTPSLQNQQLPPIDSNNLKNIAFVAPQFTIPPLPTSRRRSASPDTRTSVNPARQVFSYPVSYPQDAPPEYKMAKDDGPPPSQRRKLSSPDNRSRTSEGDPGSRRGSGNKGGMSYDPVHEYHQQAHQHHHARRPSSAASQHSHVSSYSAQSSNLDEDEGNSPMGGDQPMTRDGKKRKHKCQECGQYFTRLHNLKSHLLTHSQEKPFICQDCGHKFRRLHDLKRMV
jgi:DNA-directed RNA polymerase subunit M/transcription elongation factor TFIIS